jgi:arylsulfatase A-like enzyme
MDLLPTMGSAGEPVERTLFWRQPAMRYNGQPPQHAVRRGRWKLLDVAGRKHLFDVTADPGERSDQLQDQPVVAARLAEAYQQWDVTLPPLEPSPTN